MNNTTVRCIVDCIKNRGISLDIGTDTGIYTYIFEALGFDSYGLEIEEKAVEIAQRNDLKVFKGSFPDDVPVELLQQKYELIAMQEVIYYMSDLKKSLLKVSELLEDSGFLFIRCHQGFSKYYEEHSYFKRYGDYVQGIPTMRALLHCLEKTGFNPVKLLAYVDSSRYLDIFGSTKIDFNNADRLIVLAEKNKIHSTV